ncbi:MAG TPA: glycosyltransferase family A protein [Steroidobacteraceae bacterium]|nr:glycosyltransferase family A protein [Steroidobacteraceae bacterium]
MTPTVSVILPTFNRLEYLRPAIESVFGQTFQDWELIVADDGSDEETRAYLKDIGRRPRVKLVWLRHTGYPSRVRNAALREAEGAYVAFLDSDDIWIPGKLDVQLESIRSRPACHWSYTGFHLVDDAGNPLRVQPADSWIPCNGWIFERLLRMELIVATPSVVASRRLVLELSGFDDEQHACEDYDLWLRLAMNSEADAVTEPLVCIRRHGEHYSKDADAFIGRERSLAKMQRLCADPRLTSQIQRERAKNAVGLSRSYFAAGNPMTALTTLVRSYPYSWVFPQWWTGALATIARASSPSSLRKAVNGYRARKRSS